MAVVPRLLNAADAAAYLGLTERSVRTMAHRRQIPIVKRGRTLMFDLVDLDEWIDDHKIRAAS